MTCVLGIGDHIDCGSAVLAEGKIVAAINDERIVREKMVFGVPRRSIPMVLELAGVGGRDVEVIAVGTRNQHLVPDYVDFRDGWFGLERSGFKQALFDVGSRLARYRDRLPGIERAYYLIREPSYRRRRSELARIFREELGIQAPVRFVDHHYCHATSAYYSSGFGPEATIFSVDGGGDGMSAKVFRARDGRIEEVHRVPAFDSLGAFYSYVTQLCGFKAGRHEGKITGLAARGRPIYTDVLDRLLTFRDGTFVNVGNVFFHSAVEEIRKRLPDEWDMADVAASVQAHAERLVVEFVRHWLSRTGDRDVALAGGVFGNVRINQEVHELSEVDRCFVHPGMSDIGMGVGASLAAYHDADPRPALDTRCMETVYLGPLYGAPEIESALSEEGIEHSKPDDLEREVAALLADGAVVARFDGRMEYGPRALGNRSILYRADDPSVNDWLNHALGRTEFMPFAPAVPEEQAERCFLGLEGAQRAARFMTMTFDCTPWMQEHCPGVVHVDGTARPQLVRREDNPRYWRILDEYGRITGVPVVINTSFNIHEEPIVCTPRDAVRAFRLGHLDYLAIGPFLAKNPAPLRRSGQREADLQTLRSGRFRTMTRPSGQTALPDDATS